MEYARMRGYAEELTRHAPDPFRGYEISGDRIILAMSAPRPHEYIALRVRQQLDRRIPAELVAHTGGEVEDPSLGRLRRPDLIVVPEKVFAETTMAPFHPRDVALVGEIVSPSNHSTDYVEKMHDYPAMGIPLYLLIDPRKGTIAASSRSMNTPACWLSAPRHSASRMRVTWARGYGSSGRPSMAPRASRTGSPLHARLCC